jgi:hypothetical protein
MNPDQELLDAFTQFAMQTGEGANFDKFIEIITTEVVQRGHLRCDRCNGTLRQHVLIALLRGGRRLDHKFVNVGE